MKKIKGLLLAATVMLSQNVIAQTFAETALLFSRTTPVGSARMMGIGGTQTGLGGDYSSAFSNPAGLGFFNKSEVSFSPQFFTVKNAGDYLAGDNTLSSGNQFRQSNLGMPAFGAVFSLEPKQSSGAFVRGSFGISLTRLNNFNATNGYTGDNSSSSIVDYFIKDANGFEPYDLENENGDYYDSPTGLAYRNYLIEDSTYFRSGASNRDYASFLGVYDENDIRHVLQSETIKTSGVQNQWNFSYGANFFDKLFVGAGVGFPSIRYESEKSYRESDFYFEADPDYNPLNSLALVENLKITGRGINATFGAMVRPIDIVQIGVSYHTPTVYGMTDTYSASLRTSWNNFDYNADGTVILNNVDEETGTVVSEYTLTTPGRLNFGAAVFVNKNGFISGDVEFINYNGARYSSGYSNISYSEDNKDIETLYQPTVNYKLGGEFRFKAWRFRLGGNLMPDPYRTVQNVTRTRASASAGVGYKASKFFIDLAYVNAWGKNAYRPYTVNSDNSPILNFNQNITSVMTTVGFNF